MPNARFEPKNNKFGNAAIVLKWSERENLQSACTYAAASPGGCMFVTAHEDSNDLSVWVRTILEQDKWIYTIEGCLSHANQGTFKLVIKMIIIFLYDISIFEIVMF